MNFRAAVTGKSSSSRCSSSRDSPKRSMTSRRRRRSRWCPRSGRSRSLGGCRRRRHRRIHPRIAGNREGKEGKRDGGGAREKERGEARVRGGRGARFKPGERGAGGGGGPGARWPCRRLSARPTVTRTTVGATCSERGRERARARAGCAAGLLRAARRAVVGDWAGPVGLAWLPPALAFPFFFLKPFSFSFLVFKELENKRF